MHKAIARAFFLVVAMTGVSLSQERVAEPQGLSAEELVRWSEPVNGLVARIDGVHASGRAGLAVFLRLRNVSSAVTAVPSGDGEKRKVSKAFRLHLETSRGWEEASDTEHALGETVRLGPGESAVIWLDGCTESPSHAPTNAKIRVYLPRLQEEEGQPPILETPPYPIRLSEQTQHPLRGRLEFPEHFVMREFLYVSHVTLVGSGFMSLIDSDVDVLLSQLSLYPQGEVVREFDKRLEIEQAQQMQLLCAIVSALHGGAKGKAFFSAVVNRERYTTYEECLQMYDRFVAIGYLCRRSQDRWLDEVMIAALSQQEPLNVSDGQRTMHLSLPEMANRKGHFSYWLAGRQSPKALPVLRNLLKQEPPGSHAFLALARIGDKEDLPALLEDLEKVRQGADRSKQHHHDEVGELCQAMLTFGDDPRFTAAVLKCLERELPEDPVRPRVAEVLGELKAKEAVPVLLTHLGYPEAIEALGKIGDKQAAAPLRRLVAAGGVGPGPDIPTRAGHDMCSWRWAAAKIALARLEHEDTVPPFTELARNVMLRAWGRGKAIEELGRARDARAVPALVEIASGEKDAEVRQAAVEALVQFNPSKGIIEALICSFGPQWDEEAGEDDSDMINFNCLLAQTLRRLTGKLFGADPAAWQLWWEREGKDRRYQANER